MKSCKAPRSLSFGGDWFSFVSTHDRPHDAKTAANGFERRGFRIRIVTESEHKHHVYKKLKKNKRYRAAK